MGVIGSFVFRDMELNVLLSEFIFADNVDLDTLQKIVISFSFDNGKIAMKMDFSEIPTKI